MIEARGERWGTAAEIASALGDDVTSDMVRKWAKRDGLKSLKVDQTVYYPFAKAADIERDKRLSRRGRKRRLDVPLTSADHSIVHATQ